VRPRRLIEWRRRFAGGPLDRIRLNFRAHRREWGQIYIEPRDWWIGVYLAERAVFVCLLPCVVLKVWRRDR